METRIQKHRKYRAELIKEGATTVDVNEKPASTTKTLPIQKVMDGLEEANLAKEYYYQKQHRIKILQFLVIVIIVVAVIVGVILFGIYAFRGK